MALPRLEAYITLPSSSSSHRILILPPFCSSPLPPPPLSLSFHHFSPLENCIATVKLDSAACFSSLSIHRFIFFRFIMQIRIISSHVPNRMSGKSIDSQEHINELSFRLFVHSYMCIYIVFFSLLFTAFPGEKKSFNQRLSNHRLISRFLCNERPHELVKICSKNICGEKKN